MTLLLASSLDRHLTFATFSLISNKMDSNDFNRYRSHQLTNQTNNIKILKNFLAATEDREYFYF